MPGQQRASVSGAAANGQDRRNHFPGLLSPSAWFMNKVLYISSTLPALTVTFIHQEIFQLRALGWTVDTVSMNTPSDDQISADAQALRLSTMYLDQQSEIKKFLLFIVTGFRHPLRMGHCLWHFATANPMRFPVDYLRLGYHLIEAAYLAHALRQSAPDRIHCHFINGPTSIGMFLSLLLDIPFSFTMHASLIWLDPLAFRNKLRSCAFCVSISDYNKQYVTGEYGCHFGSKIHVVHCGIDPESALLPDRTRQPDGILKILGVGQLNRRKGFHVLIPALEMLRAGGVDFRCTIIGDGDERNALEQMIVDAALEDQVSMAGALLHEDVTRHLSETDIFVLPCVITEDGWRDGIPVALMEAMYYRIPVVSTNILGLPELIDHGVNGLLVPAKDSSALAAALKSLAHDESLRVLLGRNGRDKVLAAFNAQKSALTIAGLFSNNRSTVAAPTV